MPRGYYDYVKRMHTPVKDLELAEKIGECQSKCGKTYGYRRVHIWLKNGFFFKLCVKFKVWYKKQSDEQRERRESACTPYLHNSRKSSACQGRLPWQPFISPLTMAANFCYSVAPSALFFSITQAKRKRDPKSACEDIRYSAKANNKGCRHRETAASQKQRRGAVIPPPPHLYDSTNQDECQ